MALRLGGLADLDPTAVPLPVGTEVTTRVDRVIEGGIREKGASARVTAVEDDRVEVLFLDGKRATFLRAEVVPRKLGVARYAQRRAAAWDQLRPCVVIDTVVGSRAWGVAEEGSDEDHRGVFVLPMAWTTGLVDPTLDLTSVTGSESYWEIAANDWASLRAVAATELELPRDLRPKNAYNLIRLLDLAIRWLAGEPPEVRVSESLRPTLLAIKRGEVPMPDVMALARELTPRLEAAREASPLPKHADVALAERVLRAAREEAARRALTGAPGPWGADAPPPPEARFDD